MAPPSGSGAEPASEPDAAQDGSSAGGEAIQFPLGLTIGASTERYRLTEKLSVANDGAGTEMWAAIDRTLNRPVTVRLVDVSSEAGQRVRLQTQSLARLEHPGLLHILDTYSADRQLAVVTEQVPSQTLADELRDANGEGERVLPMTPADALGVVASVAEGLQALHESGFAHGGVTAAQVGRRSQGGFVVLTGPPTADSVRIPATVRNDVRSLGALAHELMVGAPPIVRRDGEWELSRQVPTDVRPLLQRAGSAANPWPDATSFQRACRDARDELLAVRVDEGGGASRPRDSRWLKAALAVVAVAVVATVGGLVAQSTRSEPAGSTAVLADSGVDGAVGGSTDGGDVAATAEGAVASGGSDAVGSVQDAAATDVPRSGASEQQPVAAAAAVVSVEPELVPVEIALITDFDPRGENRIEHPERLRLLNDGNPDDGWHTELYRTADFGRLKEGVGLIIDLGGVAGDGSDGTWSVAQLQVRSPDVGWQFELYASAEHYRALIDWGEPVARVETAAVDTDLELHAVPAASLLLWITDLGPAQPNGDHRVTITDLKVERELAS